LDACVEGGDHVGGYVDASSYGDVGAEYLFDFSSIWGSWFWRRGTLYSSHESGSACIIEELDFFGVGTGFGVGEGNANPIQARAQGVGYLVVHFCEPWLAVVGAGYRTLRLFSMSLDGFIKVESTYSKYLRFAAARVDMLGVCNVELRKTF
jgi:hypothetical protein